MTYHAHVQKITDLNASSIVVDMLPAYLFLAFDGTGLQAHREPNTNLRWFLS